MAELMEKLFLKGFQMIEKNNKMLVSSPYSPAQGLPSLLAII